MSEPAGEQLRDARQGPTNGVIPMVNKRVPCTFIQCRSLADAPPTSPTPTISGNVILSEPRLSKIACMISVATASAAGFDRDSHGPASTPPVNRLMSNCVARPGMAVTPSERVPTSIQPSWVGEEGLDGWETRLGHGYRGQIGAPKPPFPILRPLLDLQRKHLDAGVTRQTTMGLAA